MVPAGTDESTQDVVVYENVVAMTDTEGATTGSDQLLVGTLVQVGQAWRVIDAPRSVVEGAVSMNKAFSSTPLADWLAPKETIETTSADAAMKMAGKLMEQLEAVEAKLQAATSPAEKTRFQDERADVLEKLISQAERPRIAICGSANSQTPLGPLFKLVSIRPVSNASVKMPEKLKELDITDKQVAYVSYRVISSDYALKVQQPDANFDAIQSDYLQKLEDFVTKYGSAEDAAEAMVTIAMSREFEGKSEQAMEWYQKASSSFPDVLWGQKATGALTRLKLEGKKFPTITGVDLDARKLISAPTLGGRWCCISGQVGASLARLI